MKILLGLIFFCLQANAIPAEGHRIMISGPSPYAVSAGKKIAELGGNVVDVAVAVELVLSVTTPYYASLGGGGFALVKMNDEVSALDFREMAPKATGKNYYKDQKVEASVTGGSAVAVPGVAAGLEALHKKYGKLKWTQLFGPALELANKGFPVSGEWAHNTLNEKSRFSSGGLSAFFKKEESYKPGEILRQPELAKALLALRDKKSAGFYSGAVAEDLVASVKETGGTLTLEDLKNYKVRWLTPLTTEFEGYKIYLMPPPSSGGVVILTALKLMDKLKLNSNSAFSADELHTLSEIESRAFRGRSQLGDPDFHKNPIAELTSDKAIELLAKSIQPKKASDLPEEKLETTHFSIMDAEGHAVALTVTLNGTYGSAVVSKRFHISLNNEMDDFTTHPEQPNMYDLTQGPGNAVEPGKRPLSSMSPTLVEQNRKIVMSLGAPGGPRIITAVLQGLYRVLAQKMDIDQAIQAPRVHHQFRPDKIYVDQNRFSPEILKALRDRGHTVEEAKSMAKLYIVRLRPDGILEGAFDARGEGAAGGI